MEDQRKITKDYFENVAREWHERVYDPSGDYLKFPTGKVRQDIAISEMNKLNVGNKILDFGCGTGQLVLDLIEKGYDCKGLDISPEMISEAKSHLTSKKLNLDPDSVFSVSDFYSFDTDETFDGVTAMGFLEYLEEDKPFFSKVKNLLNDEGYAFVECRNRLFNLFSGNQYTLESSKSGDLEKMIPQLDKIEKYSPIGGIEAKVFQLEVYKKMSDSILNYSPSLELQQKSFTPFPKKIKRRQHTPEELGNTLKEVGLDLEYVVYYHAHPYPSRFQKDFPNLFNKLAVLMQPLGYTPIGSTICSSFVAVVKKSN